MLKNYSIFNELRKLSRMEQMICVKKEEDLRKVGSIRMRVGKLLTVRILLIVCLALFSVGTIYAQGLMVKGTIVDNQDEPLIGATVKVVNGTAGTVTGVDGSFTLQVPNANTLLQISYLGFVTKEIKASEVNAQGRIVLKENSEVLGEVVICG
ncbi:hypothetical protein FACS1894182_01880 [Bacteroidia bacterium]|nr:hypothetical protein FACS1894182_01880 [Bacteroidia bacterium]